LDNYKEYEIIEYQVRLFPRIEGVTYEGALFECVNRSLKDLSIELTGSDMLRLTHISDNRTYRERRKVAAALKAFEVLHDPQKMLEGGLLFLRLGEIGQAYPWLEKADNINPKLASKIAMIYSKHNQPDRAKAIIKKGLRTSLDSPEPILVMAEIHHQEGNYNEVLSLLEKSIGFFEKELDGVNLASVFFYYGIALLETGQLADGIGQLARALEEDPANSIYKMAGIYAFAKVEQWEEVLNGAEQVAEEEKIEIHDEVNGFVDVGRIFIEMNHHFTRAGKIEEAKFCQRIIEYVLKTKLSEKKDIQMMSHVIEDFGRTLAL
jgi:tetratricopeptide (TPR) repeat protein